MSSHHRLPEWAQAAAQVAQDVIRAPCLDLDARGVPSVCSGDVQSETVDVSIQIVVRCEGPTFCTAQRSDDLLTDPGRSERNRQ